MENASVFGVASQTCTRYIRSLDVKIAKYIAFLRSEAGSPIVLEKFLDFFHCEFVIREFGDFVLLR